MASRPRARRLWVLALLLLAAGLPASALAAGGLTPLTVTNCADSLAPGGLRTLMAANALILIPAGCVITLTGAAGEDANNSGDLDILVSLTIQGAGPGLSVIDGGGVDRVIHVIGAITVVISGVTIRNGSAALSGGGVLNSGATLALHNVEVTGNVTAIAGGGIRNEAGTLTLDQVTLHDNQATGDSGGGFFNGGSGTATLTNVTVSGNRSGAAGGGVVLGSGTVALNNVTITGNDADFDADEADPGLGQGGGLRVTGGSTATLRNAILAGNTRRGGTIPDDCRVTGTLTSFGSSLVQVPTLCVGLLPVSGPPGAQTGDVTGQPAGLGPLAVNGGRTRTHALLPGSPALDRGDAGCAGTDQRSVTRPQNGRCDLGAFERGTSAVASLALADFDGDGHADLIAAQGGGTGEIRVLSGVTGILLLSVVPFGAGYRGPLAVASCDLTGDGVPDLIAGGGGNVGPEVRTFDGRTGDPLAGALGVFPAFGNAPLGSRLAARGPVSVGCADVNGDGVPDVIAGAPAGALEGPLVRVFSGVDGSLLREDLAFDPGVRGVAVGP